MAQMKNGQILDSLKDHEENGEQLKEALDGDNALFTEVVAAVKATEQYVVIPEKLLMPPKEIYEFELKKDVDIHFQTDEGTFTGTVRAAHYFLSQGKLPGQYNVNEPKSILDAVVHFLNFKPSEIEKLETTKEIRGEFLPLKLEKRPDKPVTYEELIMWLTIAELDTIRKAKADSREVTPMQDILPVVSHVHGISKVSDKLPELAVGAAYNLDMAGKNERNQVFTRISLTYDDDETMTTSKPIESFDQMVHDAIVTLWCAGNQLFTTLQVYRAMTGANKKAKPGKKIIADIEESIEKQRRVMVYLDYSAEARGRELEFEGEKVTSFKHDAHMLDIERTEMVTNSGNVTTGWKLNAAPIIYRHDMTTKQITSYPQKLLTATSGTMSNTKRNMLIRTYLLQRIARMGKGSAHKIRYESLIAKVAQGESVNNIRHMNKEIRDAAKAYLAVLKNEGHIGGWREYVNDEDGRRVGNVKTGVEIWLKG